MPDPNNSQALAPRPDAFTMVPTTLQEAMEYAKLIASSSLCPKQFIGKPGDVLIAVQLGAEHGVSPIESLSNIAVINGRPTMWGDLIVGLVQASGLLEYMTDTWDAEAQTATVKIKRVGKPERVQTFSMADAAKAGLAGKDTYKQYPQRMCGWRAKSWAIRSEFADVLKGLEFREEVEDYPKDITEGATITMPRRASAADPAKVDEFLRGAPSPKATAHATTANEWLGFVDGISEKSGTSAKGKPWTLYTIKGTDGQEFGTFSETHRDTAHSAREGGAQVAIHWTQTEKGNRNIETIKLVEEPASGE